MENKEKNPYDVYRDIEKRTNGEIYIGVVGPVRTGKSTFIKRFMETVVLPDMNDNIAKERARDELPQASSGKTIMTTEPKFIPKEAAVIAIDENTKIQVRLVDCVGYMVDGASGHIEDEKERMVKTPWYDYTIPFTKAAEIGTKKVINDHSTIGVVVTTDGSFGEIPRSNYLDAEEKTIKELTDIGKPYIILLNTNRPYSSETIDIAIDMEKKYNSRVLPINCEQMKKEDINRIMENVLYEFPVESLSFYIPKWAEMLDESNEIKHSMVEYIRGKLGNIKKIKDVNLNLFADPCEYVSQINVKTKDLSTGNIAFNIDIDDMYYYKTLSEMTGSDIAGEYELIYTIRELSSLKNEYEKIAAAVDEVKTTGYGVIKPVKSEIYLEQPEVIKNGNKFGVKIKAKAPSIHMIKADIMTEIAPIVGNEEQANDLMKFINENSSASEDGIWDTNIFGKSIEQIVNDGISSKIDKLSGQTREKMQETLQKITNDSKGGVICIII